jgi:hypothetical protein
MKWIAVFTLSALSIPAFADRNVVCQGRVQIPAWGTDTDLGLNFHELTEKSEFVLWNPITDDEDVQVPVEITSSTVQKDGSTLVEVQYEKEEASHLSFTFIETSATSAELRDFKGVEGTIEFGPATLACTIDN